MKKSVTTGYLVTYAGMVAALLAVVLSVGYYAGPAHMASHRYEEGIAHILLSGRNVANPGDFDRGVFERSYVSGLTVRKDILLLGSSTSAAVRHTLFPGRSFFNNYIPCASLGDYLGILELYRQKNLMPSVVVLGLDAWVLNDAQPQLLWRSLRDEYLAMTRRVNITPSDISLFRGYAEQVIQLLSLPYFADAVENLILHQNQPQYYATDHRTSDDALILADGSRVVGAAQRDQSPEEIEASVRATDFRETPFRFVQPGTRSSKALDAFVDYMQSEGIQVVFYLPPLHPAAYEIFADSKEHAGVLQTESYLRHLASQQGIVLIGGYDPKQTSTTRDEFFDYNHSDDSVAVRIFSGLTLS